MRKRLIVLAGVIALASTVLASGAQSRVLRDSSPLGITASGTVTLSGWSVGKVEEDLLKEVIAAFERRYPNINVNYDAIPNYDQAMLAKFSARQPPDVFYLNSEKASTWISQGLIAPLDSYIKRTKFKTKRQDVRLPEGLVAARDGDQYPLARECEGSDDVGAAPLSRTAAPAADGGHRSPDLPRTRVAANARVRVSEQGHRAEERPAAVHVGRSAAGG